MTNSVRLRLDAALDNLATTLRGMTADPDEINCTCHWGSAQELARLKTPDVALDPDLLRRSYEASDWDDHAAVLRRILPSLAAALVDGLVVPVLYDLEGVGYSLARGGWQQWPAQQAAAVRAFLDAWWAHSLTAPDAAVPAYEVLTVCAAATATLGPWLAYWETLSDPVADQRLAEAVAHWERDLLGDQLPWHNWTDNEEELRTALTSWLVRHAPSRLRAHGAPEHLLHRLRLLGLTGDARWDDPHWPGHTY
ncbi:hypothetical protein AB0L53_34410 [Nonomuraea sp. NPDC052129]|uniref:hypothetical protein n=1 Tax=Nonomuraea sp. NPDC052129 TaxID=3154651 RepID=UPI003417555C